MSDERSRDTRPDAKRMGLGAKSRWASFRAELPLLYSGTGFSVASEQYRKLALHIENTAPSAPNRAIVVVVTSPDARAGKTTTSLNLALTVGRRGEKRVLVVESDLWKPEYEGMLTMSGPPVGLSDLLLEDHRPPLDRCVVSIWSTGLDILVGGAGTRNGDLVTSKRMMSVLEEARSSYDVVILDSPPFVLASGRALSAMADCLVVVARVKSTRRRSIEELLSAVGPNKNVGLVLNGVRGLTSEYMNYSAYRSYSNSSKYPSDQQVAEDKYPKYLKYPSLFRKKRE